LGGGEREKSCAEWRGGEKAIASESHRRTIRLYTGEEDCRNAVPLAGSRKGKKIGDEGVGCQNRFGEELAGKGKVVAKKGKGKKQGVRERKKTGCTQRVEGGEGGIIDLLS